MTFAGSTPVAADPACPAFLSLWDMAEPEEGRDWWARILQIRGDRALLREVRVIYDTLPTERDDRWFYVEDTTPYPFAFQADVYSIVGDEFDELCGALTSELWSRLTARTKPRCHDRGDEYAVEVSVMRVSARSVGTRYGMTLAYLPNPDEVDDVASLCGLEKSPRSTSVSRTMVDSDFGEIARGGGGDTDRLAALRRGLSLLDGLELPASARIDRQAAVEVTTRLLSELQSETGAEPPRIDRSADFLVPGAAPDEREAAALSALKEDGAHHAALFALSETATNRAVFDLVAAVRRGTQENSPAVLLWGLKALVRAEPGVARQEAAPLLCGSTVAMRGALGVFAATDPDLRPRLQEVDVTDRAALIEHADWVLDYLATATGSDEGLRRRVESVRGDCDR
ncbi:hypothetical protein ABI59_10495 [Acidobacteria bacterium Mor1]|nr:hypothetical protein ABI59_10495 [Acidobacteria bacterium Mor1]